MKFSSLPSAVITGMGTVSAGGKNLEELWQSALQGVVRAEPYQLKNNQSSVAAYRATLPEFSRKDTHLLRQADRAVHLLLAAAREAWKQADLTSMASAADRVGIIIGSSRGPVILQESHVISLKKNPSAAVYSTGSSMAGILATAFGVTGPAFTVASTCTSGATALGMAEQLLQSGTLDLIIVGAVDAPLTDSILEQYEAAGVLSLHESPAQSLRPFDRDRSGTSLGEGAAVIILESEHHAAQRKAPVFGKLNHVVLQSDPGRRASLDVEGKALQQVLKKSLEHSHLKATDIGSVHLHGTGTRQNDQIESHVVNAVFGPPAQQPLIWANKAITGHMLGASSLFQVILALKAMQQKWLPATTNCDHLDEACLLRISRGARLEAAPAICLNSGFWGNVSSVVVSPQ